MNHAPSPAGAFNDALPRVRTKPSVLGRVATILEAFDLAHPRLSLQELSERTQLPKSTIHRFATQMIELGWMERTFGGYQIGLKIFEMGALAPRRNRLQGASLPHLLRLGTLSSMSVKLGVLDDLEVICVESLPAAGASLPNRYGARMPAHCTALGKAMLAFEDSSRIHQLTRSGLDRRTARTIVDPDSLSLDLERVAVTSMAIDIGESTPKVCCMAAPIRCGGRAVAAVSVSAPLAQFDAKAVQRVVLLTAQRISNDLFGPRRSRAVESGAAVELSDAG